MEHSKNEADKTKKGGLLSNKMLWLIVGAACFVIIGFFIPTPQSMIEMVKEKLPSMQAKDFHYLGKCHEVKSMAICAELTFRAALMRSESRGFHFREDFPERDDKNWLKWIILKQDNGKMELTAQPIPIGEYNIKPTE